jgi:quercetin dioxygenase-like cupin family protein
MSFYHLEEIQAIPLVNGITVKAIYSEKSSVSFLDLPPYSRIPMHHHENEQIGGVLEGEIEYTIENETAVCTPGMTFVIPPNAHHAAVVVSNTPAKLIDIFTPPRDLTEPLRYKEKEVS